MKLLFSSRFIQKQSRSGRALHFEILYICFEWIRLWKTNHSFFRSHLSFFGWFSSLFRLIKPSLLLLQKLSCLIMFCGASFSPEFISHSMVESITWLSGSAALKKRFNIPFPKFLLDLLFGHWDIRWCGLCLKKELCVTFAVLQ